MPMGSRRVGASITLATPPPPPLENIIKIFAISYEGPFLLFYSSVGVLLCPYMGH